MGGIGIWQLVIVLLIVMMLFGTKRLKGLGSDVGEAIKGFRSSMGNDPATPKEAAQNSLATEAAHTQPTQNKS